MFLLRIASVILAVLPLAGASAQTAPAAWDAAPWIEDAQAIRAAILTKYANRDWLEQERGLPIAAAFDRLETRLRGAGSDAAARALLDRAIRQIGDGHVALEWPAAPASASASPPPEGGVAGLCRRLGYQDRGGRGVASALPGTVPLVGTLLPSGTVRIGEMQVGYVRIGEFAPEAFPSLCADAVADARIDPARACDDDCRDRITTGAYARLTPAYEDGLRRLQAAGAEILIVDLTGNGGGSEWAEAAARSLTAKRLVSARRGFVRGPHWAKQWGDTAATLRGYAKTAGRADRARLLALAAEADAARQQAETPCDGGAGCDRLGRAGFAPGLLGDDRERDFIDRGAWSAHVFNPLQHHYTVGAWRGPVIVLVDQDTASAAEEFAALLQDNDAATIIGGRTAGAGCGYTWGGTPTVLPNSRATLRVPDCVRFRRDGSNEVNGVIPDVAIAWRTIDGMALRTRLLAAKLPEAIDKSRRRARLASGGDAR